MRFILMFFTAFLILGLTACQKGSVSEGQKLGVGHSDIGYDMSSAGAKVPHSSSVHTAAPGGVGAGPTVDPQVVVPGAGIETKEDQKKPFGQK